MMNSYKTVIERVKLFEGRGASLLLRRLFVQHGANEGQGLRTVCTLSTLVSSGRHLYTFPFVSVKERFIKHVLKQRIVYVTGVPYVVGVEFVKHQQLSE